MFFVESKFLCSNHSSNEMSVRLVIICEQPQKNNVGNSMPIRFSSYAHFIMASNSKRAYDPGGSERAEMKRQGEAATSISLFFKIFLRENRMKRKSRALSLINLLKLLKGTMKVRVNLFHKQNHAS